MIIVKSAASLLKTTTLMTSMARKLLRIRVAGMSLAEISLAMIQFGTKKSPLKILKTIAMKIGEGLTRTIVLTMKLYFHSNGNF